MRKKLELEYIFSSSVKVLFSRLSTASGLSEWFADDVYQDGNNFIFVWSGVKSVAELVELKQNALVRFRWEEDEEDESFSFRIKVDPLTEDVALIITDYVDEDEEEEDAVELWNKQMDILHRTLGA